MKFSSGTHTAREAKRLLEAYSTAVRQLHIPPIDRELYEVCFVSPVRRLLLQQQLLSSPPPPPSSSSSLPPPPPPPPAAVKVEYIHEIDVEPLIAFRALLKHLERHRDATVRVMQLCTHRDALVTDMLHCCECYENHTTWSAGEDPILFFTRALKEHRVVTLSLVEAIFHWREQLSRPFPFNVAGENYIYRILDDCAMMDASALGTTLHLELTKRPLGCFGDDNKEGEENAHAARARVVGAQSMHGSDCTPAAPIVVVQGDSSPWHNGNAPPLAKGDYPGDAAAAAAAVMVAAATQERRRTFGLHLKYNAARVHLGEAIIMGESVLQRRLLDELSSMAAQSRFVTLLATPDVLLGAEKGLPLAEDSATQWREHIVKRGSRRSGEDTAAVLPLPPPLQQHQQAGVAGKGNDDSADGVVMPPEEKCASATYSSFTTITSSSSSSSLLSFGD